MQAPENLQEIKGLPELLRFENGEKVRTPEDWSCRKKEILNLFSEYMYGTMPEKTKETIAWSLEEHTETGGILLHITVSAEDRSASFSVLAGLPVGSAPAGGYPFLIEYWPWHYQNWFTGEWVTGFSENCRYAMNRGYACIQYDCNQVSQDNNTYKGAFYTLYPYEVTNPERQRGVLLAWAWGVCKVMDALEKGAGKALGINPQLSLVCGVSRYGKSAAVAGGYDERIRVVVPSCSGAGGIAVYRMNNHNKTYDLRSLGGPENWINKSINEPFSNLQGGEGYWFCGNFARIRSAWNLPVDQHMLCAMMAGRKRHLIIVTGIVSEGWNNTEGQCLAYIASKQVWDLLGCSDQINMLIHYDGHAILRSDLEIILDYCDAYLYNQVPSNVYNGMNLMKGNLFLQDNRKVLDPLFEQYLTITQ